MPNPRTAHLWRLSLSVAFATLVALGSFWAVQVMRQDGHDIQAEQHKNEPDYFIHNFSLVRMAPDGKPSSITSGTRLTHRPIDDSSEIEQPFVRSLSPQAPPMDMHAERGFIDQDNSRVRLFGKVIIDRPAGPLSKSLNLQTEALTVFPDTNRMETDRAVTVKTDGTVLTGIGMAADNAAGTLDVHSRGRLVLPAKPR